MPARRTSSLLDSDTFHFLNQSGALSTLGWFDIAETGLYSKLWRYNQHYFDDLNAFNSAARKDWHLTLLQRWVVENKPGFGIGWDPYPISLRIVNWVKWAYRGNTLPVTCIKSLAVQARFLMQRIEWHILGNHLFANAKALIFAGLFFSNDEADKWLHKGLIIISDQLPKQVLTDGGNFERSPMYHAIFLEDLLDLLNLAQTFPTEMSNINIKYWREIAHDMLRWLNVMKHPDGEIAFFNDAAIGIAPSPAELNAYANRLGLWNETILTSITHLADSGYIRISSRNALAFLDVAPVGPDYLPGHAHADTLSFELSLFGQRVFVNGGTSQYGSDNVRMLERSTSAHNTVVVNNENSSEIWDGFRVARRAYPRDLVIDENSNSVLVSCAHDGYLRLPGKPIHRRTWKSSDSSLTIYDQIDAEMKSAVAFFHVHPDITISADSGSGWLLHLPQGQKVSLKVKRGDPQWSQSHYALEFGKRLNNQCLIVTLSKKSSIVTIKWSSND